MNLTAVLYWATAAVGAAAFYSNPVQQLEAVLAPMFNRFFRYFALYCRNFYG
jgi:hypothetical protein